jgi:putative flippase GtrA
MSPVLAQRDDRVRGSATLVRRLANDERVSFVGVGAVNTLVGAVVFVALQMTLGQVVHYLAVLFAAHIISVLCAFVLHRSMVFRVTGNVLGDFVRFESVYLAALGLNAALLFALVEVGGLPVIVAQLTTVAATGLMSFFGHKYFSFRRPSSRW